MSRMTNRNHPLEVGAGPGPTRVRRILASMPKVLDQVGRRGRPVLRLSTPNCKRLRRFGEHAIARIHGFLKTRREKGLSSTKASPAPGSARRRIVWRDTVNDCPPVNRLLSQPIPQWPHQSPLVGCRHRRARGVNERYWEAADERYTDGAHSRATSARTAGQLRRRTP